MPWPTRHSPPYAVRYASIILAESDSEQKKVVAGEKLKSVDIEGPKKTLSDCIPVAQAKYALNAKSGPKTNNFKGSGFMVGLVDTADQTRRVGILVRGDLIVHGKFHTLGLKFEDAFTDRFVLSSSSKTCLLRWMDANMRESGSIPVIKSEDLYTFAREAGALGAKAG